MEIAIKDEATGKVNKSKRIVEKLTGQFRKNKAKENENEVLASLKSGKEALARLHSEMSVDDVIQLMEEVEDEIEVEREINDILAQGAGLDGLDEEALEQELLELVGGEVEVEEKAKVPDMPAAPTDKLPDASVPEVALEEKEKGPARVAVAS